MEERALILVLLGSFVQGAFGVLLIADSTPRTLTSPNYPSNYPNNYLNTFTIRTNNPSLGIVIEFDFFVLEGSGCAYDYLEIYETSLNSWNRKRKLCGSSLPSGYYSDDDTIYLKFRTDSSSRFKGFSLRYYATDEDPFEAEVASSRLILYICLGVFIPLVLVTGCIVLVFVCGHAGKAKRSRVNDMRDGQQQMRGNAINAVTVPGGSHFTVVPMSTLPGQPVVPSAPLQAPPPYDAPDYYGSQVPPPFNYVDPHAAKPNTMFGF